MTSKTNIDLWVIDSHTAGEPTRVVVDGSPLLGTDDMAARKHRLSTEYDWVRTALVLEPRGAPWMVGAVLQPPCDPTCVAGVIFFNNTGYLGMCGHGLIGVVATLAHLRNIAPGQHRFETPAGLVAARLNEDDSVSIENVRSFRTHKSLELDVPGMGLVIGDIAYGGNWFFLTTVPQLDISAIEQLTDRSSRIMDALRVQGVRGDDGSEIDHVELMSSTSRTSKADAKNFVLCPGGQYDRSPCGTGTSAKLACLAADGKLSPGEVWVQESIALSTYQATYREAEGGIIPTITGRAFITGESRVVLCPDDPLRYGFDMSLVDVPVTNKANA